MRSYVWTYKVRADQVEAFRRAYASSGEWAKLFSLSPDYRGTKLLADSSDSLRFMTIDYFQSRGGRAAFLVEHRAAYDALDRKWRDATTEESFVGEFEVEE